MRIEEIEAEKASGSLRLRFLGGSLLEGFEAGVSDSEPKGLAERESSFEESSRFLDCSLWSGAVGGLEDFSESESESEELLYWYFLIDLLGLLGLVSLLLALASFFRLLELTVAIFKLHWRSGIKIMRMTIF